MPSDYGALIDHYANLYHVPKSLAHVLVGQESGGFAGAVSRKGATGITQVMPSTAAGMYGISEQAAAERLKNPMFALDAGMKYLSKQFQDFGSWRLALAAYNAGPNAVREYGGIPPFKETVDYVHNILTKAGAFKPLQRDAIGGDQTQQPGARPVETNALSTNAEEGLAALASGNYDPQRQLGSLFSEEQAQKQSPDLIQPPSQDLTSGLVPANIRKWAKLAPGADRKGVPTQQAVLEFVAGLAQSYGKPLRIGTGSNHNEYTVDKNVSDHWRGMAADIPASGSTLRKLGRLALINAGMSKEAAMKAQGGIYNVGKYQIIFDTLQGGNHFNHLHVGIRG